MKLDIVPKGLLAVVRATSHPVHHQGFTPRLRVTLRVGNEFEGETDLIVQEADTMSTLQAEQDAIKAARKKFRYVELISVKPVS